MVKIKLIRIVAGAILVCVMSLYGPEAMGQRRYRRVIKAAPPPSSTYQPLPPVHRFDEFATYGPFGKPYHPFFDPYGRYNRQNWVTFHFDKR